MHNNKDGREVFLCGMRAFFGLWLLYAGVIKWLVMKPQGFVGFITGKFDATWSPHLLNLLLAWLILCAEPLIALWILTGRHARCAWQAAALLMFLLLLGQTILMSPDIIINWFLTVLCLGCAAISGNCCSDEKSCCQG